jgi:hypothetical protein
LEQIAILEPKDLDYGDEAGMDSRDDYPYGWNEKGNRFYVLKSEQGQGTKELINMLPAYCQCQLMLRLHLLELAIELFLAN